MTKRTKGSLILVSGILILALALGVTVAFAQTDEPDTPDSEVAPPLPWGRPGGHGFHGQLEGVTPLDELLAEELGVTVEALQDAHAEARAAAMEQDGFGFRGHHGFDDDSEYAALLADALGVDVEELQAAQDAAHARWLDEMVEAGYMTEEQASLIEAQKALKPYLDREALMAGVLGIDVEELQAAREAGTPMSELLGDMSFEEFAAAMQDAYQAAVQQAADDNVITDEQAEQILSGDLGGFHGFGGRGGSHGFGCPGGFKGFGPADGGIAPTGFNI